MLALLPSWLPAPPSINIEPFQLTSFALSMLLVFRTNASYARFDEGRRKFGTIATTCRNLTRQVGAAVPVCVWGAGEMRCVCCVCVWGG